jgi:hypothetical protein
MRKSTELLRDDVFKFDEMLRRIQEHRQKQDLDIVEENHSVSHRTTTDSKKAASELNHQSRSVLMENLISSKRPSD